MVRRAAKLLRPTLFLLLLLPAVAWAKDLADYEVGETATEDISTPVPLTVVDRDATEMLRFQEATRVPVVFRFNPQAALAAEKMFRTAFAEARDKFLTALEKNFQTRKLDAATLASPQFQDFVATFSTDEFFPADKNLFTFWAKGEPDDSVQAALAAKLRGAANQYIRPEDLPKDLKPGARVQMLTSSDSAAAPTLKMVQDSAVEISRMKLVTLAKARGELLDEFSPEEQGMAKYLAGLVQENCAPDADLTRQSRTKQTAEILSADHYDAGQMLVHHGQAITAKTKAALAELDRQYALGQSRGWQIPWSAITLIIALPLVGVGIWQLATRRQRGSMLPVKFAPGAGQGMVVACPTCAGHIVVPLAAADGDLPTCGHDHGDHSPEHWRRRALTAEARAEQATAIVRAGLLPQIARFLSGDLVKRMISQRADLLAAQNQAADKVEDLTARLDNLETAPNNWRSFYERRIAELEKELATKDEENRALIRTQIAIARRQMADAQGKAGWN